MTAAPAIAAARRSRLAGLTLASSSAFSVVTLLLAFVATPLFLKWLGEERFGAFRALTDWGGYLGLLELGLGGALGAVVSRAASHGGESLRDALASGSAAYRRVAVRTIAVAAVLVAVAPWLVPVNQELVGELRLCAALSAAVALALPLAAARPALEALQHGYAVNAALVAQGVVVTLVGLLLARLGWGMPGMAVALVVGAVLYHALALRSLRAAAPDAFGALWRADESRATRDELRRLGWPTFVLRLSGTLALLSDNVIVAWLLGPAAVVPFFLTQRLPQVAAGQLQAIGGSAWAGLAEVHHQGDLPLFRQRVIELTRLVVTLGVAALGPVLLLNDRFVTLWVGEARFGGWAITLLAVVNGGLLAVLSLWGWLFAGTGKPQALVTMGLVSSAVNIAVSLAATWGLGPVGPLVGSLVGMAGVSAWWTPRLMKREFSFRLRELAGSVVEPLVRTAPPLLLAAAALAAWPHEPGWPLLLAELAGLALLTLAWAWRFTLNAEERARWRGRIGKRGNSS